MTEKAVIVMVGLPARGKSYIAQRIVSYYRSAYGDGASCRLFNAGKERRFLTADTQDVSPHPALYRTVTHQPHQPHHPGDNTEIDDDLSSAEADVSADPPPPQMLFDTQNDDAVRVRDQIALATLQKMCVWLQSDSTHHVAIFDATNTTAARRAMVVDTVRLHTSAQIPVIFIESICTDADVIHQNIVHKVRHSPDYLENPDKHWCYLDFKTRLENYERIYEPCDLGAEFSQKESSETIALVRVVNQGAKIQLQGGASPAHESTLMCLLHGIYHNTLDAATFLPLALDTITKARSGCSSTSSSLFSLSSLMLSSNAAEEERLRDAVDEAAASGAKAPKQALEQKLELHLSGTASRSEQESSRRDAND
ncbi:LAQU0S04e03334g1_1 [Lachancea quebecensis]|uniref:LAQU0S04e03334g1_1 n=1 Tax=Lachancea quebecensis TaxID=1654605 RepID=A0A0P1KSG6_9SACH|nr:LAQU0S04e03334g1_1 [Lachancea quebecensis]